MFFLTFALEKCFPNKYAPQLIDDVITKMSINLCYQMKFG